METIGKLADGVRNSVVGDSTAQSGVEPPSGVVGEGTPDRPYDAGNLPELDSAATTTNHNPSDVEPPSGITGKGTAEEPYDAGNAPESISHDTQPSDVTAVAQAAAAKNSEQADDTKPSEVAALAQAAAVKNSEQDVDRSPPPAAIEPARVPGPAAADSTSTETTTPSTPPKKVSKVSSTSHSALFGLGGGDSSKAGQYTGGTIPEDEPANSATTKTNGVSTSEEENKAEEASTTMTTTTKSEDSEQKRDNHFQRPKPDNRPDISPGQHIPGVKCTGYDGPREPYQVGGVKDRFMEKMHHFGGY